LLPLVSRADDGVVILDHSGARECESAEAATGLARQMAFAPGVVGALSFPRLSHPNGHYEPGIPLWGRFPSKEVTEAFEGFADFADIE
jgi:hypothetical protein